MFDRHIHQHADNPTDRQQTITVNSRIHSFDFESKISFITEMEERGGGGGGGGGGNKCLFSFVGRSMVYCYF